MKEVGLTVTAEYHGGWKTIIRILPAKEAVHAITLAFVVLLQEFAPLFTQPSFETFKALPGRPLLFLPPEPVACAAPAGVPWFGDCLTLPVSCAAPLRNVPALQDGGHVLVSSRAPSRCTARPASGSATGKSMAGSALICTACASRPPTLVRARELKAAGTDWTEVLAIDAENRCAQLPAEVPVSSFYHSTDGMVRAFVQQGGDCQATFFNYWRRLKAAARKQSE